MALADFRNWYENRHAWQQEWKQRTGRPIVGYFCTYAPEEIFYAFDVLPVRIMGSHGLPEITEPHIYPMFCPYCRDVLAQGLSGKYDYLDGIVMGQSCIHLRQAFTSWELHRNPGWSHYLPMPNHVQSPRAIPFLKEEYNLLIQKLERLTGRTIGDADLEQGIRLMNRVRRMLKRIWEYRKQTTPSITGAEAMLASCASFFTHAEDWLRAADTAIAELRDRHPRREPGRRLMLVGSENDDLDFLEMVEDLGSTGSHSATVVVEEHCTTTRYFWDETEENSSDPLAAIAARYCSRTPCPSKDWPRRTRLDRIIRFAREFNCDGALILQQKFCDPHEADYPFVRDALEEAGFPTLFLEFDVTTPVGAFSLRVAEFLETLATEDALY